MNDEDKKMMEQLENIQKEIKRCREKYREEILEIVIKCCKEVYPELVEKKEMAE